MPSSSRNALNLWPRPQAAAAAWLMRLLLVVGLVLGHLQPAAAAFHAAAVILPLQVLMETVTTPPVINSPPGTIQYRMTVRNVSATSQASVPHWRLSGLGPVWTYQMGSTSASINGGPADTTNPTVTTDGSSYLDLVWKSGVGYALNANDTLTVLFTVAVPAGAKTGEYLCQAQGTSLTAGLTTTSANTAPVTVGGKVSVDASMAASSSIVTPATVPYALMISNNSNSAAPVYAPKLTLTQPDAVVAGWTRLTTGITMTWSRAQAPPSSAVLASWNFQDLDTLLSTYGGGDPNLNPGEWVKLVYSYQVSGAAPSGSYDSRCKVQGSNVTADIGSLARVVVNGASAEVNLSQSASTTLLTPGTTTTLSTVAANTGTMTLTQHDVSAVIPVGLTIVAGTSKWRVNNGSWTAMGEPTLSADGTYHWAISTSLAPTATLEVAVDLLAGSTAGAFNCTAGYASGVLAVNGKTSWTPMALGTGLKLWLDGKDLATITKNGSNQVSQWNDKSGNANHALQGTGGNQPVYDAANTDLVFNGSTRYLTTGLAQTFGTSGTIVAVLRPTTAQASYAAVAFWRGTASGLDFYNGGANYNYHWNDNGNTYGWDSGLTAIVGSRQVAGLFVGPSSTLMSLNGTTATNAVTAGNAVSAATMEIGRDPTGGARYFNGGIGEVVVTNTTLSTTDRQTLEGYLAWKWGTQASLPGGHPYKNFSPSGQGTTEASTVVQIATDPWTPANLGSALDLWLDGQDAATITKNGSNQVSQWNDKSGNGRNATQGTTANKPLYTAGTQMMTFDGTDDYFTSTLTQVVGTDGTIYAVTRPAATQVSYAGMVFWRGTATGLNYYGGTGNYGYHWNDAGNTYGWNSGASLVANTNQVVGINVESGSTTLDLNGTDYVNAVSSGNATSAANLTIGRDPYGASRSYTGSIGEIIVCRDALSPSDKQKLEGYLAWKWGTQTSLPITHPYRYAAPTGGTSIPTVTLTQYAVSPSTIAAGGTVTYTFKLTNTGTVATAKRPSIKAVLPGYLTYRRSTSNLTVAAATVEPSQGTVLTWDNLTDIGPGQTLTLTFNVQVDSAAPPGVYYLEASASGANFASVDSGAPPSAGTGTPALTVTSASAVDLAGFRATATPQGVTLAWRTNSEIRHLGFTVYRSTAVDGARLAVAEDGAAPAPTDQPERSYRLTDRNVATGQRYYYWLEEIGFGGLTERYGPLEVTVPETGTTEVAWQPAPAVTAAPTAAPTTADAIPVSRKDVATYAQLSKSYLSSVSADDTGITFDLRLPPLQALQDHGQTRIVIPGLPTLQEEGQYELPMAIAAFALPVGAAYTLQEVERLDPLTLVTTAPPVWHNWTNTGSSPQPVATPTPPVAGVVGGPNTAAPHPTPAPTIAPPATTDYGQSLQGQHLSFAFGILAADGVLPATSFQAAPPVTVRDLDLLRVQLFPVFYDSAAQTVTQYRRMRYRLQLAQPAHLTSDMQPDRSPFERALAVLATEQGVLARWQAPAPMTAPADELSRAPDGSIRLRVSRPGLQRISAARLAAAGLDLSAPDRLQLWHRGRIVPLHVRLDQGQVESLTFVATEAGNRYEATGIYDLGLTDGQGERLPTWDAAPDGEATAVRPTAATYRQPKLYVANAAADAGSDHWFSDYLAASHPAIDATLTLADAPATPPMPAKLIVAVAGLLTGDRRQTQRVAVQLNDESLGEIQWQGGAYQRLELPVAAGILHAGANHVRLSLGPEAGAVVYLDQVRVQYTTAWSPMATQPAAVDGPAATIAQAPPTCDVYRLDTDQRAAVAVNGRRQLDDLQFAVDADHTYATVTTDDGSVQLEPMPAAGPDLRDPTMAAAYLLITPRAWAAEAERLAAQRQTQGLTTRVIPVEDIYEQFAGGQREPEAIRRFLRMAFTRWQDPKPSHVLLFGDGHYDTLGYSNPPVPNPLPPLFRETTLVGEVPDDTALASLADGQSLPSFFVGRLPIASEADARTMVDKLIAYDGAEGDWLRQGIAAADDDDPAFAQSLALAMDSFEGQSWSQFGVADADALKQRLATGAGLTLYVGHGSDWGWAQEDIFTGDDLASFQANGHAGVVIAGNCLNAYFASPQFPSLAEAMLTLPGAGATAYIGSTAFTLPANQSALMEDVCRFAQMPGLDLGAAVTLAKIQLFLKGGPLWEDEITGWELLGDPGTRLRR